MIPASEVMSRQLHRAIFSSLFGLACFFCLCTPARPQAPGLEHAIGGSVRNAENDSPISQVHVQLRNGGGSIAHPTLLTNDNGEFYFGLFRSGEYEVLAELEGYQPARLMVDTTRHDEINVIIRLRKTPMTSSAGDVITAHQLSIPQKAHDAFDKGVAKAESKADYQGAIGDFQAAIKDYPAYYESYAEMGLAYIRLNDFTSAEQALRKSIELSSAKYPPPLVLLSMLLNNQNHSDDAEPIARHAIAAEPKNWRGHYELARALFSLRRVAEAEAAASTARDLKPENSDVHLLLIEIHRTTHNAAALRQDLDAYLKLAPQGPAAPQVRHLREQLLKYMESLPKPAAQP
jgi:tetratricopeptide (TPR) repeat protein